jgi:PknH-like extracellular domain
VKNGGLVALIPEDAQIMELVGRPALVVETTGQGLRSMPNVAVSEPQCFGAIYATSEYEYRGSGYHASFGLQGDDPDTMFTPDVVIGATTFDDSTSARQFVDDEIAKWSGCANRPLNAEDTDSQTSLTWVAVSPATANGPHTVTRTLEGRRGFGCTRALATRSNVVADADVCAPDATTTVGQASTLVETVVDNIGR